MSLCTRNRWTAGTSSSNSGTNDNAKKEIEEKLKKIKEERDKMDTIWIQLPCTTSSVVGNK
jgi:hypothetical protein